MRGGSIPTLELAFEPVVGRPKVFGDNAGFADGGHEVGVASPAGHDVEV